MARKSSNACARAARAVVTSFFVLAFTGTTYEAAAMPANDDCAAATAIGALPFSDAPDTTLATVGVGDPVPECGSNDNNVWYSYTPGSDTSIEIVTAGSPYDTNIAVYTGACGALTEIACNDDTLTGSDSQMIVTVEGGTTIYIAVADNGAAGGILSLAAQQPALEWLPPSNFEDAVLSSDATPLGGAYGDFDTSVAYSKRLIGFSARTGAIMANIAGVATTIALAGDPAPPGGTFSSLGDATMNDAGDVVFRGRIDNGPVTEGLFIYSGGVLSSLHLVGDASPDGGTYRRFDRSVEIEDSGNIAFVAATTVSGSDNMLLVDDGVTTHIVATEDDPTACGGVYSRIASGGNPRGFDLADTGLDIAFFAAVNGGGDDGIFVYDGATVTASACENTATPLGGTFRRIGQHPAISSAGFVTYVSELSGAPVDYALWADAGGGPIAVIQEGSVLSTGETVDRIDDKQTVSANAAGEAVFLARVVGATTFDALIEVSPAVPTGAVRVGEGDPCLAGTVEQLDDDFEISSTGDLAFEAICSAGRGAYSQPAGGAIASELLTTDATTAGPGFRAFNPANNTAGDTVFMAQRYGAYTTQCTAGAGCAPAMADAVLGDPIPGLPGEHVDLIYTETVNGDRKNKVFSGAVAGVSYESAIFRINPAGTLVEVVRSGDPLPGLAAGTFSDFTINDWFSGAISPPSADKKNIVFHASIDHPTSSEAIFAATPGGAQLIAADQLVSPTGGTFEELGMPIVTNKAIVFRATTTIDDCVYHVRRAGLPLNVIACDGDPGPLGVGGTISFTDVPPAGGRRNVVFTVDVSGGTSDQCIVSARPGVLGLNVVHCKDDVFVDGEYMEEFSYNSPIMPARVEAKGKGLTYTVTGDESLANYLVVRRKDRYFPIFASDYDMAPLSGGYIFMDSLGPASMNKKTVTFTATLSGGTASDAVFVAGVR